MPINFPSFNELITRNRSDVRAQLPDSDPTIFGSFIRAVTDSIASRAYDIVLLLRQAVDQLFPQTATGDALLNWAAYEDLTQNPATPSSGFVVFNGTPGASIPVNTPMTLSGVEYTTQAGVSVSSNSFSVLSIARSGTTATATSNGHPLASGIEITISGADQAEYNGTFEVTVINQNTFTYEVSGTPATPATGAIVGSADIARVFIECSEFGQVTNAAGGAVFSLVTAITNVNQTGFAQFEGIVGGTDIETEDELRARTLESRANPVANFNEFAIKREARKIPGVTDVFVKKITPNVGDVTIYFFRNNDTNPIPSASEIAAVRDQILTILPATSNENDVYVLPPAIVKTPFTFSAISPDTPTMRSAITSNLTAFFEDRAEFEANVTQDQYRNAIISTQDTQTGDFLESFTLTSPSGDITIGVGQIARAGTVTFT